VGGKSSCRAGDVILCSRDGASQQSRALAVLAERIGRGSVSFPFRDDGTLELEKLSSLLTPEVKIFAFTHVSNSLARLIPWPSFAEKRARWRSYSGRRGPKYRAHAVKCSGTRLRLPCFLRSQNVRADRNRCALTARTEILEATPPYHGGGEMLSASRSKKVSYKKPPIVSKPAHRTSPARSGSRLRSIISKESARGNF